jgi:hypothetical protein
MSTDTAANTTGGVLGYFAMTTLIEEPRLSGESLKLLQQFEDAFRARIYNLVEDEVRQTGERSVSRQTLQRIIERALREYVEQLRQLSLPNVNG